MTCGTECTGMWISEGGPCQEASSTWCHPPPLDRVWRIMTTNGTAGKAALSQPLLQTPVPVCQLRPSVGVLAQTATVRSSPVLSRWPAPTKAPVPPSFPPDRPPSHQSAPSSPPCQILAAPSTSQSQRRTSRGTQSSARPPPLSCPPSCPPRTATATTTQAPSPAPSAPQSAQDTVAGAACPRPRCLHVSPRTRTGPRNPPGQRSPPMPRVLFP